MLRGIPDIIGSVLLKALADTGHGDQHHDAANQKQKISHFPGQSLCFPFISHFLFFSNRALIFSCGSMISLTEMLWFRAATK